MISTVHSNQTPKAELGKGIAQEALTDVRVAADIKTKRLGMVGMRERVEMIGGSFAVESVSDTFSTVRVELPARFTKNRKRRSRVTALP